MIGPLTLNSLLVIALLVPLLIALGAIVYVTLRYSPVVARIFETQPLFMPLQVKPVDRGEPVDFTAVDGIHLKGTYLRARTQKSIGMIVFCHEFLSDRWSFHPYLDQLRDRGFSLFTFDFRNHGTSENAPEYSPLQWTSEHEIFDLRGALSYLRGRADHDPSGFGLFGVSRGGTTALIVGAGESDVWGVVTDGAFPTQGTMVSYMIRWARIYVPSAFLVSLIPMWLYHYIAWRSRRGTERSQRCRFPDVEAAVARLSPRPWLMIHGERDNYIGPEIARSLFDCGKEPKELWLVPNAKHNRCRETAPELYTSKLLGFMERNAPRRPLAAPAEAGTRRSRLTAEFSSPIVAPSLTREVATPISG